MPVKSKHCYVLYGIPTFGPNADNIYEVSWINLGNPSPRSFDGIQSYLSNRLGDRVLVSYVWADSRESAEKALDWNAEVECKGRRDLNV